MDKPDIWAGDGPQLSEPSPTVICQFEHAPLRCTFPDCTCSGIPPELRRTDDGGFAFDCTESATTTPEAMSLLTFVGAPADGSLVSDRAGSPPAAADASIEPGYAHPEPETQSTGVTVADPCHTSPVTNAIGVTVAKRQPKRDRAKYMRDYRSRRKQARTQ